MATTEKNEEFVNLNEDLQGHKHDDSSFEKAMKNQEETRKTVEESKKSS